MKSITLTLFAMIYSIFSFGTIGPITGHAAVCVFGNASLADTTSGGLWSSSDTSIVTIDTFGNLYGVSLGIATITYTVGSGFVTRVVTVNPIPPPIQGNTSLCIGESTILKDSTGYGDPWLYMYTAVSLDIGNDTSVRVWGVRFGVDMVSYVNIYGCRTSVYIIVNSMPPVTGIATIHVDSTTILSNAYTGGKWSSSNTTIATVDSITGIVTGISAGIATIVYKERCSASTIVTVLPPVAVPVVCAVSKPDISLFPNPTTSQLNISSSTLITAAAITNLMGQTHYSHHYNSPQVQVDVSNLPPGIYLIRINGTEVRKFMKQ